MRLLIVTSPVYPQPDANSGCVKNLLPALRERGCEATVLALSPLFLRATPDKWEGCRYVGAFAPNIWPVAQLRAQPLPLQIMMLFAKVINRLAELALPACKRRHICPTTLWAYRRALRKELRAHAYDAVLATLFPPEAALAVQQTHGATPWYVHQLDPYCGNTMLPPAYRPDRERLERMLFLQAGAVFTTPVLYDTLRAALPAKARLVKTEFPCLVRPPEIADDADDGEPGGIRCAFVGSLYEEARSPNGLVALIAELSHVDAQFSFTGARCELVEDAPAYARAKAHILLRGSVPRAEADRIMAHADVLVNIDNRMANQVPSKIFDYMSTGKPILNLYERSDSPALAYFETYPLALNLRADANELQENAAKAEHFLRTRARDRLPFDEVASAMKACTPAYVAQQMLEVFRAPAPVPPSAEETQ